MMRDTIAAVATGRNASGISIIRVSGQEAVSIADRVFVGKNGSHFLKNVPTHTVHYGKILSEDEVFLDEVLAIVMRSPKSYTAEDVVEIHCHGGITVTNMILEQILKAGARLAEPGEFTKRAFLNGRIDLSEAEAVMDVIDAGSKAAVRNSEKQLAGHLKQQILSLRETILHQTAFIESALDDPEHFDLTDYPAKLKDIADALLDQIRSLLKSADEGKLISEGIRAVILGKPNVGKSTFLNLLLGQQKAIVTDIAGTTRDILEERLTIRDIPFVIMDTAGIREAQDVVEKIGVDRAREAAADADLLLYLSDLTSEFDGADLQILSEYPDKKKIILLNKSDLDAAGSEQEVREKIRENCSGEEIPVLSISARNNVGIDAFRDLVEKMFFEGHLPSSDEFYITNLRHKEALMEAATSLEKVEESIRMDMPEDFYSIDLMDAYMSLGRIIGEQIEDDLVEEIFSKFCMGK
ncbi:MAG: tRNA uridine-5-carboxymethylaminomethyl(34) synthesis GTPase MnmE [Lachnospiraceae bacterium]|nr:tRNA uridine-5-carboxymethylaminomethyl(34) synthesis GTPase MnmE [Lachnospiraceae bacterium]